MQQVLELPLYAIALPTPFAVGPVNVYLVTEPEPLLIDTGLGLAETLELLEKRLGEVGLGIEQLKRIVITHGHQDHYGLAETLASRSGAPLYAPPADELHFTHSEQLDVFYDTMLEQAGVPRKQIDAMAVQFRELRSLAEPITSYRPIGQMPPIACADRNFETIQTPGHTPGSVSFFEPRSRLLLSADTVLKHITPNPVLDRDPSAPGGRFRSLASFMDSLDRIERLAPAVVYTAHGDPVDDFCALRARYRSHHEKRQAAVLDCLDGREASIYQLAACLFPDERTYNSFLAVSEVFAHLDLLEEAGRVTKRFDGRVAIYKSSEP